MKNSTSLILAVIISSSVAWGQNTNKSKTAKPSANKKATVQAKKATPAKKMIPVAKPSVTRSKATPAPKKIYTKELNQHIRQQLSQALEYMRAGQHLQAANAFFSLSRRSELRQERPQLKYFLGLSLMELNLNQIAAFQFVDVIRSPDNRYRKQAIEKLSVVADRLGDETLLNYSVLRLNVSDFPAAHQEMLLYRLGEVKLKGGSFSEAASYFSKVGPKSRFYYNAMFNKGLAELEAKQTALALSTFQNLLRSRSSAKVTDTNKVAAQIAIARTYYQMGDFDNAIQAYNAVPRDHVLWHDALFEKSWAMLRSARFRSALSNFQSLHSTYYEDAYIPESLLLRSIIYLYICKYDEMEKVLTLFETQYNPIRAQLNSFLRSNNASASFFNELDKAQKAFKTEEEKKKLRLPYTVLKHVLNEGDVKRGFQYLTRLSEERRVIEENAALRNSSLGQYAVKILTNRVKNTKLTIGDMGKAHLLNVRMELRDLNEQAGFIRYEMINGQKESMKKKLSDKNLPQGQINENVDKTFYVENGYEYYPFQGEYWLDEVGNYHYLGQQSCEE